MKLDDVVERDGIANVRLIKIDSEGSEMEILYAVSASLLSLLTGYRQARGKKRPPPRPPGDLRGGERPDGQVPDDKEAQVDMTKEVDGEGPVMTFLSELGKSLWPLQPSLHALAGHVAKDRHEDDQTSMTLATNKENKELSPDTSQKQHMYSKHTQVNHYKKATTGDFLSQ
eukprot:749626-Hanusia_phi.AAC.3